jgi:adenosylcobyric acid synthase
MLGRQIVDQVESRAGAVDGLGLLPVETAFAADKVLRRVSGAGLGAPADGYEIRHGRVRRTGGEPLLEPDEGCRAGSVMGTSWHGLLEGDAFRRALLAWVADVRGRRFTPGDTPFAAVRERRLDAVGDLVADHVDAAALSTLITEGPDPSLPLVTTGIAACSSS